MRRGIKKKCDWCDEPTALPQYRMGRWFRLLGLGSGPVGLVLALVYCGWSGAEATLSIFRRYAIVFKRKLCSVVCVWSMRDKVQAISSLQWSVARETADSTPPPRRGRATLRLIGVRCCRWSPPTVTGCLPPPGHLHVPQEITTATSAPVRFRGSSLIGLLGLGFLGLSDG